jgi:hypothetical protein
MAIALLLLVQQQKIQRHFVNNGGANLPIVTWILVRVRSGSVIVIAILMTYVRNNWVENINAIGLLETVAIRQLMTILVLISGVKK